MTSANVIEYDILKGSDTVGHFRKHIMCRLPDYSDLLKYQPLKDHSIVAYGYDEEEEFWSNDEINLEVYLRKMIRTNKKIREYFENE